MVSLNKHWLMEEWRPINNDWTNLSQITSSQQRPAYTFFGKYLAQAILLAPTGAFVVTPLQLCLDSIAVSLFTNSETAAVTP